MNKAILSTEYPQFAAALRERGYQVIPTDTVSAFLPFEQRHADMQCLILGDTAFVLSCCQQLAAALRDDYHIVLCGEAIDGKYPANVALNAAVLGSHLLCRTPSLDDKVRAYCAEHGYELLHVNQGYAKCSCAVVSENALITSDNGIYHSLKELNFELLKIEEGRVLLPGVNYGFIGGASGWDQAVNTLYFCGDITKHPDSERIVRFCEQFGVTAVSLTTDPLTDIGGILFC